jgi:hypothetical protein
LREARNQALVSHASASFESMNPRAFRPPVLGDVERKIGEPQVGSPHDAEALDMRE